MSAFLMLGGLWLIGLIALIIVIPLKSALKDIAYPLAGACFGWVVYSLGFFV